MEASNVKAMRDALVKIYTCVDDCDNYDPESKLDEVIGIADAALSAPPRQCDMGTAEDQAERFAKYCDRFHRCNGCPCCGKMKYNRCEFIWAQTPYAEEGGAE